MMVEVESYEMLGGPLDGAFAEPPVASLAIRFRQDALSANADGEVGLQLTHVYRLTTGHRYRFVRTFASEVLA